MMQDEPLKERERRAPTVLFVVTEDWYFVSHRLALATRIREAGFRVVVATRVGGKGDVVREAGLEVRAVPFERSLRHPLRDLASLRKLNAIMREVEPDIVHLVALKPILVGSVLLALLHRRTPALWAFTGMGFIFSSDTRLARTLRLPLMLVLRVLNDSRRFHLIVQNNDDLELLRASGLVRSGNASVIAGSGLDTADFTPGNPPPANEPPLVLFPARLLRDKGIYEFAAAARELSNHPSAPRFVLAGRRDADNHGSVDEEDLQQWLKEGIVEWLGHRDDMASLYRSASVVCLPSYREGLPKALLEAAACARPLVASDVPGCREICQHGETGFLVPPRDGHALADAIARLMADPALGERFGRAGRTLVQQRFGCERIAQQTVAQYRVLLAAHHRAAG